MGEVKEQNKGLWVMIQTATRVHFGRLRDFKELTDTTRNHVYGAIKNNQALIFDILLDYFSPVMRVPVTNSKGEMMPDPQNPGRPMTNIGRESILTNFEHIIRPGPIAIFNIEMISFIDEQEVMDRQLSEQMIDDTLKNIMHRRMADSNLVLPTGGIDPAILERAMKEGKMPGMTRMEDTPDGKPHFKVDLRNQ